MRKPRHRFVATLLLVPLLAGAGEIEVMTQNQYLGADISPLIATIDTPAFNDAVVTALRQISANRSQERFKALAAQVLKRRPHLVGLQEVWKFDCIPALPELGGYPCNDPDIAGAFSDHLAGTLAALGPAYSAVAQVRNFSVQSFDVYPGIPFYINGVPAFLRVMDRDVILARSDVVAAPVALPCAKPSMNGCNFSAVVPLPGLGSIERGFVAVDAMVDGKPYRFINTHLEVQGGGGPGAIPAFFQALQAGQLIQTALGTTPAGRRLIIVGDMNSSPNDPSAQLPFPPGDIASPYMQFTAAGLNDAWLQRPGNLPGLSCCEQEDLRNKHSQHYERIDLIFSRELPWQVKEARLIGETSNDKTMPHGRGLWPSDHASVAARLLFR